MEDFFLHFTFFPTFKNIEQMGPQLKIKNMWIFFLKLQYKDKEIDDWNKSQKNPVDQDDLDTWPTETLIYIVLGRNNNF